MLPGSLVCYATFSYTASGVITVAHDNGVYIGSEINKLERVLLHRPGSELAKITIDNKDELLIDEIIWVERAASDHEAFAALLRENGVEVIYFQDCLADIMEDLNLREAITNDALSRETHDHNLKSVLKSLIMEMNARQAAQLLVGGLTKREMKRLADGVRSLTFQTADDGDFFFRPLPNLYFQRDPYFFVRNGVLLSSMKFLARQREPMYAKYIFQNHEIFRGVRILFGDHEGDGYPHSIEGGDFLVLDEQCVAIGVSERSSAGTVQIIGSRLASELGVKRILAVDIPKQRAFMHLDTVFTMVDKDAFTIYPDARNNMRIWDLEYGENGALNSITEYSDLSEALKRALFLDKIRFIETGGGDPVAASRDQWNDGTNTLAISPGIVVSYECNSVSNKALRDNGIIVHEISGSELGKGRGGPRCMSMPIKRQTRPPS
jgi:arginine deiminase